MFKKFLVSKLIKIKIIDSKPGKLNLKIDGINKISEEYFVYEKFLKQALVIKEGVKDISVDFSKKEISIFYDKNKLTEEKVMGWINKVKDIGFDNYELITEHWDSDPEYVVKKIKKQLEIAKLEI